VHRRFTHTLLAIGTTAGVALAACSNASDRTVATSITITSEPSASTDGTAASTVDMSGVSLKVAISTENALGMLTEQSGVFADAPYDIEWVQMSGSNETMEAVNAGAVDVVASVQVPAVVLAQANSTEPLTADNAPFKVVAAWELRASKGFVLVVPTDSTARTVADLDGHSLALAKGAWGQYFWVKAMAAAGLAEGDVEEVMMPASEGRTAFRAGHVDALITGHRTGLTLQDEGSGRIIASADQYSPYMTLSLVRKGLLDDPARAAAAADVLQRLAAEDQWINDHPEMVAQEFITAFDLAPATATLAARAEVRTRVPFDEQTVSLLQDVADTFLRIGTAKGPTDVSILIDDRFDQGLVRGT